MASEADKCAEQIVDNIQKQGVQDMIMKHSEDGQFTQAEQTAEERAKAAVVGAATACRNFDVSLDFGLTQGLMLDSKTGQGAVFDVPAVSVGIAPKKSKGIKM